MSPGAAAAVLVQCARRALAERPCFAAALCGDAAGRVAAALARQPGWPVLPAARIHLFVLDGAAPRDRLPLPASNLHRPRATLSRADAALHYELLLRAHFSLRAGDVPVFDLVVLDAPAAAGDAASQLTRLVVPSRDGRGVALSASVIGAATRVVALNRIQASTARSIGAATPATSRAARNGLSRP